jgi:hypothetical protein
MYTKQDLDEVLSQVQQEFEKALGSINKSEEEEEIELAKSEEEAEEVSDEENEYETIEELYSSMTKSEMEAHYASIKKVLFGENMEKAEDEDEDEDEDDDAMKKDEDEDDLSPHAKEQKAKESQKKMRAENAASGAMDRNYDQAARSEVHKSESTKVKMNKSEVEAIKAENEELKKNLDNVTELLNKMFETTKKAPAQKAITGMTYVAKSEEGKEEGIDISKLSKSEITNKLKGLDYGTLSKSDKDAINSFYLNNGSVEKIKHLIIE